MKFRTTVQPPSSRYQLTHKHKIMLMGSCFAQHMVNKLQISGFDATMAIGVLYNPDSIASSLYRLLNNESITADRLFFDREKWQSFDFPSQYAKEDKQASLSLMQTEIEKGHAALTQAQALLITFGTAYVYELKTDQGVVANCHRVDASLFNRRRLQQEEIVNTYNKLILNIKEKNPEVEIIFTLSPVRHWKDGAHGNQISKSILLLAIEQICQANNNCQYFPSYEIMMDDLRDYRFYNSDMLHPNETAIKYIWEQFSTCFFDEATQINNKLNEKRWKRTQHRPHHSK